jgi:hypothetical protein
MHRALLMVAVILTGNLSASSSVGAPQPARTTSRGMEAIKPGMTRADLLRVFETEGGLSTALQRRYVSRDCRYFKVDVAFKPIGRPERDADGRQTRIEAGENVFLTISRPYVERGESTEGTHAQQRTRSAPVQAHRNLRLHRDDQAQPTSYTGRHKRAISLEHHFIVSAVGFDEKRGEL